MRKIEASNNYTLLHTLAEVAKKGSFYLIVWDTGSKDIITHPVYIQEGWYHDRPYLRCNLLTVWKGSPHGRWVKNRYIYEDSKAKIVEIYELEEKDDLMIQLKKREEKATKAKARVQDKKKGIRELLEEVKRSIDASIVPEMPLGTSFRQVGDVSRSTASLEKERLTLCFKEPLGFDSIVNIRRKVEELGPNYGYGVRHLQIKGGTHQRYFLDFYLNKNQV